ncbi:2-oxo acid dehydrogenase subunit E2, partial [bacterium LRH843]|nr:2-oxo acid dehydrogenase subunit E2 [bacterium LRH843]
INLETLTGSGGGGRITRKDVLAAIEKGPQRDSAVHQEAPKTAPPSPKADMKKSEPIPTASGDKAIPVSGVRKAIASNM